VCLCVCVCANFGLGFGGRFTSLITHLARNTYMTAVFYFVLRTHTGSDSCKMGFAEGVSMRSSIKRGVQD